jgi:hypothetical protein
MLSMTRSECARFARAELETIIAGLGLDELAELLKIGRHLSERGDVTYHRASAAEKQTG